MVSLETSNIPSPLDGEIIMSLPPSQASVTEKLTEMSFLDFAIAFLHPSPVSTHLFIVSPALTLSIVLLLNGLAVQSFLFSLSLIENSTQFL